MNKLYTVTVKNNTTGKTLSNKTFFSNFETAKAVKDRLVKSHVVGGHNVTIGISWMDFDEYAYTLYPIEEETVTLA